MNLLGNNWNLITQIKFGYIGLQFDRGMKGGFWDKVGVGHCMAVEGEGLMGWTQGVVGIE